MYTDMRVCVICTHTHTHIQKGQRIHSTRKWTSRDKGIPHVCLAFTVKKI